MAASACTKTILDSLSHVDRQSLLTSPACASRFHYLNLIHSYYLELNENTTLTFTLLLVLFPFLFLFLAAIAHRNLAHGMKILSHRLRLSPTLSAITLIAFANGAPDILSSIQSSKLECGNLISLGSLYGAFIFSSTLVISSVIKVAGTKIRLPKMAVVKEMVFYALTIVVVFIFGFIGKAGYGLFFTFLIIYVIYALFTVYIENTEGGIRHTLETFAESEETERLNKLPIPEEDSSSVEEEYEEEEAGLFERIEDRLFDEDSTWIENILTMPLNLIAMVTISDPSNPLLQTPLHPFIIVISLFFTLSAFKFIELSLSMGLFYGLICLIILQLAKQVKQLYQSLDILYQVIGIFAAIGWLKIFTGLVIDCISFVAFYFTINHVILATMVLSVGNTVSDLFANSSLSRNGEPVMGAMACYSCQLFNNYFGFGMNVLLTVHRGKTFDLFNRFGTFGRSGTIPLQNIFIIATMISSFFVIVITMIYLIFYRFTLRQWFSVFLVTMYLFYFFGSIGFWIYATLTKHHK